MKHILMAMAMTIAAATLSTPAPPRHKTNPPPPASPAPPHGCVSPPPPLLFPEPRMIHRVPVGRPPLYLRVPPGHARDWRRHCHRYGACGERVYFVQDNWYRHEYAPRYQERHIHRDYGRDGYRDDYRRHERRDHRDDHRGDDRGRGRGDDHGRGHGRDH